jgi:hypothetical protein
MLPQKFSAATTVIFVPEPAAPIPVAAAGEVVAQPAVSSASAAPPAAPRTTPALVMRTMVKPPEAKMEVVVERPQHMKIISDKQGAVPITRCR